MHELSIAMSIIEGATEEAARHPGEKIAVVHLQLGKLSGVVKEALLFSYEVASAGTCLEGSILEINEVPAMIFCAKCKLEKTLPSIQHLCCPVCGTASPDVRQGRELLITGLELIDEYAAANG